MSELTRAAHRAEPHQISGFGYRPSPISDKHRIFKLFLTTDDLIEETVHLSIAMYLYKLLSQKLDELHK